MQGILLIHAPHTVCLHANHIRSEVVCIRICLFVILLICCTCVLFQNQEFYLRFLEEKQTRFF